MTSHAVPTLQRMRGSSSRRQAVRHGLLYASPVILGVVLFWIGPMLYAVFLTTQDWNLITPPHFIGLDNIRTAIHDPVLWKSLTVTAYYTLVGVPIQLIAALALALLLNQEMRGRSVYRLVFYLPSITPIVASSVVFSQLFNTQFGAVNHILSWFGISPVNWLFEPKWAVPALILMSLWFIGPQMIIFLAGLQGVPENLMEAATIDGASAWQRFRNVVVPMISPTILFNLIMGIIGSFQVFAQAFIMTNGGPEDATRFLVLYIYQNGFQYFKMGYAATISWLLFFIIVIMTAIQFMLSKRWVYYEGSL